VRKSKPLKYQSSAVACSCQLVHRALGEEGFLWNMMDRLKMRVLLLPVGNIWVHLRTDMFHRLKSDCWLQVLPAKASVA
jgi:hypothetical protein